VRYFVICVLYYAAQALLFALAVWIWERYVFRIQQRGFLLNRSQCGDIALITLHFKTRN